MDETVDREVCIASNPQALRQCYAVLAQCHANLDEHTFEPAMESMRRHGFQVAYVRSTQGTVACVATYLVLPLLTHKQLQVHDLITDAHNRGHGYGKTLMDWLIARAEAEQCKEVVVHTTCETDANRRQAFLLCKGFVLDGFRFTLRFDDER